MNTTLTDEQLAPIKAALHRKSKIEAIKLYREITHVGLAEAKYAVEQIEVGAPPPPVNALPSVSIAADGSAPETKTPTGVGCIVFLLILAAGGFGICALLASGKGQEELASRYQKALGPILCVYLTTSATLNSFNPRRRAMAVAMWVTVLFVLSAMVYQAVWR